jgi:hypothetical protein
MKKTTKTSGASVNLTTASVHRLIKPMNKTTQGRQIINSNDLLPDRQTAERPSFSTKTATLQEPSNILEAVDEEDATVLALLDPTA